MAQSPPPPCASASTDRELGIGSHLVRQLSHLSRNNAIELACTLLERASEAEGQKGFEEPMRGERTLEAKAEMAKHGEEANAPVATARVATAAVEEGAVEEKAPVLTPRPESSETEGQSAPADESATAMAAQDKAPDDADLAI